MLREAKEKAKIRLELAQRETLRYNGPLAVSQVGIVCQPGVYDSLREDTYYDDKSDYSSESEFEDDSNDGSLNCSSVSGSILVPVESDSDHRCGRASGSGIHY